MPELDEKALERRMRKREKTRLRVQRHRAKAEQRAEAKLARSLTKLTLSERPFEAVTVADRTAQALLKGVCKRHGIDLDTVLRPVGEALKASKVRRIGKWSALLPAWQERLRASEQGWKVLERAGEVPVERQLGGSHITVNVLMLSDSDDSLVTNPVTNDLEAEVIDHPSPRPAA